MESRGDVLVFTTPPFARDTEVTGPVSLDLWVQPFRAGHRLHRKIWTWPLVVLRKNLTEGTPRMRYRGSQEK